MVGILRGLGQSVVPMIVSLAGSCAFRLLWIATVFQAYPTPSCLYISYPISWAITALAHVIFFFIVRYYINHGGFKRRKKLPKAE